MSAYDFSVAMAALDRLSKEELDALLTAAKFIFSGSTKSHVYAFSAVNIDDIKLDSLDEYHTAMSQMDMGGFRESIVVSHRKMKISFTCLAKDMRGMLITPGEPRLIVQPQPPPLTPEQEREKLEELFAITRGDREGLI